MLELQAMVKLRFLNILFKLLEAWPYKTVKYILLFLILLGVKQYTWYSLWIILELEVNALFL